MLLSGSMSPRTNLHIMVIAVTTTDREKKKTRPWPKPRYNPSAGVKPHHIFGPKLIVPNHNKVAWKISNGLCEQTSPSPASADTPPRTAPIAIPLAATGRGVKMYFCYVWMILHDLVTLPNVKKLFVLSHYAIPSRSNNVNTWKWPKTLFLALWIIQKCIFVVLEWSFMTC